MGRPSLAARGRPPRDRRQRGREVERPLERRAADDRRPRRPRPGSRRMSAAVAIAARAHRRAAQRERPRGGPSRSGPLSRPTRGTAVTTNRSAATVSPSHTRVSVSGRSTGRRPREPDPVAVGLDADHQAARRAAREAGDQDAVRQRRGAQDGAVGAGVQQQLRPRRRWRPRRSPARARRRARPGPRSSRGPRGCAPRPRSRGPGPRRAAAVTPAATKARGGGHRIAAERGAPPRGLGR